MSTHERQQLIRELEKLPEPNDPWLPPQLNNIVFNIPEAREILKEILPDKTVRLATRFKAYYGLLNILRRSLDFSEYETICNQYFPDFSTIPMSYQIRSQMFVNRIQKGGGGHEDGEKALFFAEKAVEALPNHFGVTAHWAAVVAEIQSRLPNAGRDMTLIARALRVQEDALKASAEAYPSYFRYKSQLLMLLGRWDEALTSIGEAIDRENSALKDYAVRVGAYRALQGEIEINRRFDELIKRSSDEINGLHQETEELRDEAKRAKQSIDDARASTLTLLGLLAAVVAFLTTSVNISTRLSLSSAVQYMAVASAAIVVVFSSLLTVVVPVGRAYFLRLVVISCLAIGLAACVVVVSRG
jgi:tetratricopeptide (TPR) repeat protein